MPGMEDLKWLTDLGPVGLLIILTALTVVSMYRGWLVSGAVYRREQKLHDSAREALLQSLTNGGVQNELLRQIIAELRKPAEYRSWGDTADAPPTPQLNYRGRHAS
jgi:hypothetical protein